MISSISLFLFRRFHQSQKHCVAGFASARQLRVATIARPSLVL